MSPRGRHSSFYLERDLIIPGAQASGGDWPPGQRVAERDSGRLPDARHWGFTPGSRVAERGSGQLPDARRWGFTFSLVKYNMHKLKNSNNPENHETES